MHSFAKRRDFSGLDLTKLTAATTTSNTSCRSGAIDFDASAWRWSIQWVAAIFGFMAWIRVTTPLLCPVIAGAPSVQTDTHFSQLSFSSTIKVSNILKISSPVALPSSSFENKLSSINLLSHRYRTYTNNCAALLTSVHSSSWSANCSHDRNLSVSWDFTSKEMSLIRLLTVSLDSGMDLILFAASSPTITRHISTAAGSINSSPIVWGFLHLAIRRAARYDACCAFSGIVVMLVSRTFCLTYSSFFLWKKSLLLFACSGWIVVRCRLSLYGFSASTDKIFKHSVHCGLPSLCSIKPYFMYDSSNLRSLVFFMLCSSAFTFSAETLHPLSKNLSILKSLRIYQRVHVVVH